MGSRPSAEWWVLALSSILLLAGWLWVGLRTDFLPCTLDCGETYEAAIGARNLSWPTGGLQDFAAGSTPAAHPALYLHNPNLGMYVLAGLGALGVRELHSQTPWLVLPFLLGMLYLYLAVRATCQSGLLAALCLLQASSLYLLVTLWAFDALRVWSWLLTFGLIYHLSRGRPWHLLVAGLLLALSFGVDYPFALFLGALAVALAPFRVAPLRVRSTLALVLLSIGGALALRQLQVAMVVGPAVWWADVTISAARRIPLVSLVMPTPEVESWARASNFVVWPGGGGMPQPLTWAWMIGRSLIGAAGWPLIPLALGWIWAVRHRARFADPFARILTLSLAVAVSIAVTFMVFGEYVASFYGLFLMPLTVHWLTLLLGGVTALLLAHWNATVQWGRVAIPVGGLLLVALIGWRGATEARNVRLFPPVGYPGREALADYPGASVATLWISSAPSVYTGQWAASLRTMRWLVQGRRGFTFDPAQDYYAFFERDRDNPAYRHPDLLLIPRLHAWGLGRRCDPLGGAVYGFADGCADLTQVEQAMTALAPVRRGPDYLLYDLRGLRDGHRLSPVDRTNPQGVSSSHRRTGPDTGGL